MPTLAEIIASKKKKPVEVILPALPSPEILTSNIPDPSDIHHILAFLYLIDNPEHHADHIALLDYFNIEYTPWIIKSASEQPSQSLALLVVLYYAKKYPIRFSMELSSHVLRGVGRVLNDQQQELLMSIMERKLQDG